MDPNDDVDAILERWTLEALEDPEFDPLDDLEPDHPHREELVLRWTRLVEQGLLETAQTVWGLPPESIPRTWQAARKPEVSLREYGGRYLCFESIGAGGMGEVFRAFDVELERDVAVKVLRYGFAESTAMRAFLDEARLNAGVEHPSIVPLYDVGAETSREIYFVMKLVEGSTLRESIVGAVDADVPPFTPTQIVRIVRSLAEALALSHERGLLHRDLKPSNVMIGRHGEVQLMDWGVARPYLASATPTDGAELQTISGTPQYMSPEQARGEASAEGPWSDLFSLGALMYELLTGGPPYRGESKIALQRACDAQRGDALRPDWLERAPRELVAIADKAMERRPEDRYATADELIDDLEAFTERRAGSAWSDGPVETLRKTVARRPVAAVAIALGLVTAGLAFGFFQSQQRAAFEASVNERTAWMERAQGILDRPRGGLSDFDRYDEAARRIQATLADAGIDVLEPKPSIARFDELRAEDPPRAELATGLLHDLGLAIVRSGAIEKYIDPDSTQKSRLARIREVTLRQDPTLGELWEPYRALRSSVDSEPVAAEIWDVTGRIVERGVSGEVVERLAAVASNISTFSPIEARTAVRLLGLASDWRHLPQLRDVAYLYPGDAAVHDVIRKTTQYNSARSVSLGRSTPVQALRQAHLAAAASLAGWAASPQSLETGVEYALRKRHLAGRELGSAEMFEGWIRRIEEGDFDEVGRVLDEMGDLVDGYKVASLASRAEEIQVVRALLDRDPDSPDVVQLALVSLADAAAAFRRLSRFTEDEVAGHWRALSLNGVPYGVETVELEREYDHVEALARRKHWDREAIFLNAAESRGVLGQLDVALETVDEGLAKFPNSPRLADARRRILGALAAMEAAGDAESSVIPAVLQAEPPK
ncbi:MAG: serine/threonine-protein kinase [Planctomycetota bacterium]